MNRIALIGALGAVALTLAGCMGGGPKQDAGALTGAVAGALVGGAVGNSNIGAVAVGALVGGFIGNEVGADLDAQDRKMAMDAEYRALEYSRTGVPIQWHGHSGRYGDVIAGASYRVNDYNCRDYTHTIYIDGQPEVARGTACRQPDDTWKVVT